MTSMNITTGSMRSMFPAMAARVWLGLILLFAAAGAAKSTEEIGIEASHVNTEFLAHQDDVSQIVQVVMRERQGRDRGWWDQMMTTYWPDSRVDLSWYHGDGPGFVTGSRTMYEGGARPIHRMLSPAVDINGDRAHLEVHAMTWSTLEYEDQELFHNAFMRLNYRLEQRGGEWRIAGLNVVYEYSQMGPSQPGLSNPIPTEELQQYRKSYATLSWNLANRGVTLAQDELGEDRPGELRRFYRAVKEWVNGGEFTFEKESWSKGYEGVERN